MKTFTFALTIAGLAAGAAQATSFRDAMDRERELDRRPVSVVAQQTIQVPAGDILSIADLQNENLSASDLVTVTSIPSTGVIDTGK